MMAKQIYEKPPPLAVLDPSLPPPLVTMVEGMLAKDPAARPTMKEVTAQLTQMGAAGSGEHVAANESAKAGASGHTLAMSAPGPNSAAAAPPRTLRRVAVAVGASLLAIALSSVGGWLLFKQRHHGATATDAAQATTPSRQALDSAAPARPDTPPSIRWTLISEPAGAQVLLAANQQVLGTTPWRQEQPKGHGREALIVRLAGHRDQLLILSLEADESRQLTLTPVAPEQPTDQSSSQSSGQSSRQSPKQPPRQPPPKPAGARPSKPKQERSVSRPSQGDLTDKDIKVVR